MKKKDNGSRPFKTHYPGGLRVGHAATLQGALRAAHTHLLYGEASKATITGPNGGEWYVLAPNKLHIHTWSATRRVVGRRPK